jgi:hypothetical protein
VAARVSSGVDDPERPWAKQAHQATQTITRVLSRRQPAITEEGTDSWTHDLVDVVVGVAAAEERLHHPTGRRLTAAKK